MSRKYGYIGHLPRHDPLHDYLQHDIFPQLGLPDDRGAGFRVFRLGGSNEVYLYEERHSRARVVGKFFGGNARGGPPVPGREPRMLQEFHNLHLIRSHGLVGPPHEVVRPLGCNLWLSSLLVVEYRGGQPLSDVITEAIHSGQPDRLYAKLTALAYFLATFHNRTTNGLPVNFHEDCDYLDRIVVKLLKKRLIDREEAQELSWLRERWREQPRMWEDQQVLVHGDATPSNFLFGHGLSVTGIDLERMKSADRVFDIGRITGELQHFFLQMTRDKYAAEPFIGHFLWEYACHFPERDRAFRSITGRVPFQMGLTLLRIARNSWLSHEYRRSLIEEAKMTLRTF
jgi:aminoglycoside phosphotransferase (APT) family kinase protein